MIGKTKQKTSYRFVGSVDLGSMSSTKLTSCNT